MITSTYLFGLVSLHMLISLNHAQVSNFPFIFRLRKLFIQCLKDSNALRKIRDPGRCFQLDARKYFYLYIRGTIMKFLKLWEFLKNCLKLKPISLGSWEHFCILTLSFTFTFPWKLSLRQNAFNTSFIIDIRFWKTIPTFAGFCLCP